MGAERNGYVCGFGLTLGTAGQQRRSLGGDSGQKLPNLALVVAVGAWGEGSGCDLVGRQRHRRASWDWGRSDDASAGAPEGAGWGKPTRRHVVASMRCRHIVADATDPRRTKEAAAHEGPPEPMKVHLVDGTYELFRYHFAMPSHVTADGQEVAATRGVLNSMQSMIADGVTHIAVATDTVIESWRNDLYEGYKDGSGVPPELFSQFPILEEGLALAGFTVWGMIEHEADDALAAGAAMAAADPRVEQVMICTPDKDLAQCVTADDRVVQFDRRKRMLIDHAGVIDKFGVAPESIPDYLALVGDTADGFPGLKGWGTKSTATVLAQYGHLENIPTAPGQWEVGVRGAAKLAATLADNMADALLFRRIATVDRHGPQVGTVDDLTYRGPQPGWAEFCERIDFRTS